MPAGAGRRGPARAGADRAALAGDNRPVPDGRPP